MPLTIVQKIEKLKGELMIDRSSFLSHWRQLGDVILPRRPKFTTTDRNRGDRRTENILDSTATLAVRTLKNGMMAGMTNPSRPWFKLTVGDRELGQNVNVLRWLFDVTQIALDTLARSNFYSQMPIQYEDVSVFGTSAMAAHRDADDVIRFEPYPIGSYFVGNDAKGQPRVFIREFEKTVRQVVEEYATDPATGDVDRSKLSDATLSLMDSQQWEAWIKIVQAVIPNDNYDPQKLESKFKKYLSVHYELGHQSDGKGPIRDTGFDRKVLRESGFDLFPILISRWQVNDGDAYGTSCPGMDALPDIKQLQRAERRGLQAIDKMVSPPLMAPPELRGHKVSQLPGDITYVADRGARGIEPLLNVNYRLSEHEAKQAQVRLRIQQAFHADTFRALLENPGRQPLTAREVEELHAEKMVDLIPVLEQSNQDLFDPLIDILFAYMLDAGLVPPPPEELEGQEIQVEYVSVMSQAQKLVGLSSMERFATFVTNLAAQTGEEGLLDRVNFDAMIEAYGIGLSVPPEVIKSMEEVEAMRAQRAAEQQQAQQLANIQAAAGAAKDLASADTSGENALTAVTNPDGQAA